MTEYAAQVGRPPFDARGRLVARRAFAHGDVIREIGADVPRLELTDRQIGVLWDQGWIDTLPVAKQDAAPKSERGRSSSADRGK